VLEQSSDLVDAPDSGTIAWHPLFDKSNDRAEIERLRAALTCIRDSKPFVDGNAALRRIAEKALASAPTQGREG